MRDIRARMVSHALGCERCREVLGETVDAAVAASFMRRQPEWYAQATAIVAGGSEPTQPEGAHTSLASMLLRALDAAGKPIEVAEDAIARWAASLAEWITDRVSTDSLVAAHAVGHCSGSSKEYRIGPGLPDDWWCEKILRFEKGLDNHARVTLAVLADRTPKTRVLSLIIAIEDEPSPALVRMQAFDHEPGRLSMYVGDVVVPWETLGDEQRVAVILVLPSEVSGE